MNHQINRLIQYGLQHQLISKWDQDYSINLLLDLFQLEDFQKETICEPLERCDDILNHMLDYACLHGIINDTVTERDLFDTRIMNCLMPRPSEVINQFNQLYLHSPREATQYFYHLSLSSHYIRKERIEKNISFKRFSQYSEFEITINLSKPEKDPKEIAKMKNVKSRGYPKCLLCKENVGYAGRMNHPARQNHRIIPVELDHSQYYLQYSPYVYYNEHCIVFNESHIPMVINKETFKKLLSFVEQFPHYMLGSNADLPIVGGSILSHDHFQGGCHNFPIEKAEIIKTIHQDAFPQLKIEIVKWPLSTIRLTSKNKEDVIEYSDKILSNWIHYSNPSLQILAYSDQTRHNTVTPIARMVNGEYQMDIVLRNNRTNEQYPDGIFHPHQNLHHIKKENIGLIEVMGLAVLPARLKNELTLLKDCLLGNKNIDEIDEIKKHKSWYVQLKNQYQMSKTNVDEILSQELTNKYVQVLEDAGVFKMNDEGIGAFVSFVENIE